MQYRVGASPQYHNYYHSIFKCFAGHDIGRLNVFFQQMTNGLSRREQVTNYEVDKTVRVTRGATGTVRRLSAAEAEAANPRIWYECQQAP